MIVTNPLFNKFFPCVFFFLISKILPSGGHFSLLVLQIHETRGKQVVFPTAMGCIFFLLESAACWRLSHLVCQRCVTV